jgi:hypothetical protein
MVALVGPVGIDLSEVRASPRAREGPMARNFRGYPSATRGPRIPRLSIRRTTSVSPPRAGLSRTIYRPSRHLRSVIPTRAGLPQFSPPDRLAASIRHDLSPPLPGHAPHLPDALMPVLRSAYSVAQGVPQGRLWLERGVSGHREKHTPPVTR